MTLRKANLNNSIRREPPWSDGINSDRLAATPGTRIVATGRYVYKILRISTTWSAPGASGENLVGASILSLQKAAVDDC